MTTYSIEIDADVMGQLVERGLLSLNDFRCLDAETKKELWRMYLTYTARAHESVRKQADKDLSS